MKEAKTQGGLPLFLFIFGAVVAVSGFYVGLDVGYKRGHAAGLEEASIEAVR